MFKKDNLKLGLIIGLFAPLLGMVGFYFWKFSAYSFIDFIKFLLVEKHLITGMVSFSLLANAIFFTLYINTHKDKTARGIFIVTCVYAILALVLKLVY
jgi:hypothetical protein